MTGFPDLALPSLTAERFPEVRVKTGGCWVCCWGKRRGFAQLREGSDDPPPPVRIGASAALADATPKPASRLSRTIIIAETERRRETRCMTYKPLTDTKQSQLLAYNVLSARKLFFLPMPAQHQIARAIAESQPFPDTPIFTIPPS